VGLCRASGVLLAIEIVATVFWAAPYAVAIGYDCSWFDNSIGALVWQSLGCLFAGKVGMAKLAPQGLRPVPVVDQQRLR